MNKLDDNFEKLKQSMLKKKLKAEASDKNAYINVDVNTNKDVNIDVDKNVNSNVYTNVDKNTNTSDYNNVNNDANNITNNNVNKFVIKANQNEENLVRYTLYLKPETINQIAQYAKQLNLGKSELARKILEETLNNLEIV